MAVTVPVTFACGHAQAVDPAKAPVCLTCGETRVSRCQAPAPRFVGHVQGPSARTVALEPVTVDLREKEPQHG